MLIAAPKVTVADTIGAGDTFTAGLSVALYDHGVRDRSALEALGDDAWHVVLRFAATAAALNCTREGANPPTLAEVQTARRELKSEPPRHQGHQEAPSQAIVFLGETW